METKICAVVQTNYGYKKIDEICQTTWMDIFLQKGYDICYIDYTNSKNSFIENLLIKELKCYEFIVTMFDDLYFTKIKIPDAKTLNEILKNQNVSYIRFDGRPPAKSNSRIKIENINYYKIEAFQKYMFSTVLGCFKKSLLQDFHSEGIRSAWDIEKIKEFKEVNLYAPSFRTASYRNIIVKGKLDIVQLILVKETRISFLQSFKKMAFRTLKKFKF